MKDTRSKRTNASLNAKRKSRPADISNADDTNILRLLRYLESTRQSQSPFNQPTPASEPSPANEIEPQPAPSPQQHALFAFINSHLNRWLVDLDRRLAELQRYAQSNPQARKLALRAAAVVSAGLATVLLATLLFGIGYVWIASQLPPAEELRSRSHQFATTQILDKDGNLLWEIIDPTGGRRTYVTLDQISPYLIASTLATEDRYFYINVGVDPIAIARAVFSNFSEGQIVSGASTITQQLARNIFLDPKERTERSFSRKIREGVLAVEINRRYSKDQILEFYLNQIYYGNLAYGIEAAARTYFGKSASELTLSEAAMLAGLPQSPAIHDPFVNPNGAKARQQIVLGLLVEAGYITLEQARDAAAEPLEFQDLAFPLEAPHFVSLVRQELEQNVPPAYIYQAGLQVYTTLDPHLQAIAEEAVLKRVNELADRNVSNGALVAMDVTTGNILALVGSKDFRDEKINGQVNMITSLRQPASTIKPLTYLAAFERLGWTPSTLMLDVPVEYPDDSGNVYRPRNMDDQFHGPVSVRAALANSYNIPAVKTLEKVKISALKEMAARLGITTLNRNNYGLSLTLGSGEVSVLEMTGAYQAIANQGILVQPTTILKITDNFGREIKPVRPQPRRVLHEAHAYLITHILADNEVRTPAYDPDGTLQLSRPAAAKTGTTNDFRDSWTIGYTPEILAGVWVGNADNQPMVEVDGVTGAGHIWRDFMERAHEGRPIHTFIRPPSIIEMEVCADSGTIPSEACPETHVGVFFQEQPPLGPEHDIHRLIEIDLNTDLLANEFCRTNVGRKYYRIYPPDGREWALEQGIEQPPRQYCPSNNLGAQLSKPVDNISVRGIIDIEGTVRAPKISYYQLELGAGTDPEEFMVIQEPTYQIVVRDLLATFDTTQVANGAYTLRLLVSDQIGGFTEDRIRILVDNPPGAVALRTPITTPPPTFTPTPTKTPIGSPVATVPPLPTVWSTPAVILSPTAVATAMTLSSPTSRTVTILPSPVNSPSVTATATVASVELFETPTPTLVPEPTEYNTTYSTDPLNIPPQPSP